MMRITLIGCLVSSLAMAQEGKLPQDEPGPLPIAPPISAPPTSVAPAEPVVPDVALQAMRGRPVELSLADGRTAAGELSAFDAQAIVLVGAGGAVFTVPRGNVVGLRLLTAPPAMAPVARVEEVKSAPVIDRHLGVHFGFGPGIAAFDVDYRPFYLFASATLGLPLFTDGHDGAVMLGIGGTFRIVRSSAWQFDIFAHATVAWLEQSNCSSDAFGNFTCNSGSQPFGAIGVGAGFHYTFANGFTVGFKVPVIGAAFAGPVHNSGDMGAYYYLSAVMSLPIVSFGYRF